jgi:ABC-type lipoprotein release transport system permease subunit
MMLALLFALGTVRSTIRESLFPQMLKAGIIGRKLTVKVINRVPKMLRNRLTAVHDDQMYQNTNVRSRDNYRLPFVFQGSTAAVALAVAVTLNLAFSVLPSSKAASVSPLEALMYE